MVDMHAVRQAMPSHVTPAGNIDPVAGVMQGSPALIRKHVMSTVEKVGMPYMVNAGCEIPPDTPHENFRALCEPIPCSS